MKRALFFLLFPCLLPVQADESPPTKYAEILGFRQTVVIEATSYIGTVTMDDSNRISVAACEVSARTIHCYGLRLNGNVVDFDEIKPLVDAIDSLCKLDKTATRLDSFEATYTTRGGLRFFRSHGKDHPDVVMVSLAYTAPNGDIVKGYGNYTAAQMSELKALILKAEAKLQEIQK